MKPKVVVIGLDGSSWELVRLLQQHGKLPHLQTMEQRGVATTLRSTHPAHSAPAWTSFATGVPPTAHGCLDFLVVNRDIDDLDIIDSTKIKQETIYETMVRHGRTPILINLPNTFPPKLSNHITITSLMTRGEQWVFPMQLQDKYPSLQRYRLSPNAALRAKDNLDAYVEDVRALEADRIAAAKELFLNEPWDFFFFLSSGTDWVSHVVYDKAVREQYQPAWRIWEQMDDLIGWIMEHLPADTSLLVMSDHGFRVYDGIFYMNRWLEQQGYLATTAGSGSFQQEHTKLSREVGKVQRGRAQLKVGKRFRRAMTWLPGLEPLAKWLYTHVIRRYFPVTVTVDLKLDLAKTQVGFPRGSMASMLYVNDTARFQHGSVPPEQRHALAQQLQQELTHLQDSAGQAVVGNVWLAEELYGAHLQPLSPDLFLESDRYYLSGSLHSNSLFERRRKNYHDGNGMFLAYGPLVRQQTMATTDLINLPPTILRGLGLPIPPHHTGEPLDIFTASLAVDELINDLAI